MEANISRLAIKPESIFSSSSGRTFYDDVIAMEKSGAQNFTNLTNLNNFANSTNFTNYTESTGPR
jgi:hypothetical protein